MFPYLQQQNIQNIFNLNILPCAINGSFIKYMEMRPLLLRTFYVRQRHLMVIYYFAASSAWDLRTWWMNWEESSKQEHCWEYSKKVCQAQLKIEERLGRTYSLLKEPLSSNTASIHQLGTIHIPVLCLCQKNLQCSTIVSLMRPKILIQWLDLPCPRMIIYAHKEDKQNRNSLSNTTCKQWTSVITLFLVTYSVIQCLQYAYVSAQLSPEATAGCGPDCSFPLLGTKIMTKEGICRSKSLFGLIASESQSPSCVKVWQ